MQKDSRQYKGAITGGDQKPRRSGVCAVPDVTEGTGPGAADGPTEILMIAPPFEVVGVAARAGWPEWPLMMTP